MGVFQVLAIVIGLANLGLLALLVWRVGEFEKRFCDKALHSLQTLERQSTSVPFPPLAHHHRGGSRAMAMAEFFVNWRWTNGSWQYQPGTLPKGADPGLPPAYPGSFEGQVVKTWVGRKA